MEAAGSNAQSSDRNLDVFRKVEEIKIREVQKVADANEKLKQNVRKAVSQADIVGVAGDVLFQSDWPSKVGIVAGKAVPFVADRWADSSTKSSSTFHEKVARQAEAQLSKVASSKPSETKIVSATDVGKAYEAAKQEQREVEKDNAAIMMYEGQGIFMSRQNRVMFGASPAEAAGQSCNGFKREGECVIC